jgi:hypothetical protein
MPHFSLATRDGESLGAVLLGRPDWPVGSIIYRGDEPDLRVVGRIDRDVPDNFDVLMVEELEPD